MDRLTVIHEAGHVAVARYLGGNVRGVTFTQQMVDGVLADACTTLDGSLSAEDLLVVCLAGYAAERLVGGDEAVARAHAEHDFERYEWMLTNSFAPEQAGAIQIRAEQRLLELFKAILGDRWGDSEATAEHLEDLFCGTTS